MWREITFELSYHKWKLLALAAYLAILIFPYLPRAASLSRLFLISSLAINFMFYSYVFFQRKKERTDRQHLQFPFDLRAHAVARILVLLIPQVVHLILTLIFYYVVFGDFFVAHLYPILIINAVVLSAVIATQTANDFSKNYWRVLIWIYWIVLTSLMLLPFYEFLMDFFRLIAGSTDQMMAPNISAFTSGWQGALYFNAILVLLFISNIFIFIHRKSYLK